MLIGEVCKRASVTKEQIRHYESLGLIYSKPRPAGSRFYRDYNEETLKRLELIAKGKALGFKLREIKPLLDLRLSDSLPLQMRIQLLEEKLTQVEETIKAYTATKQYLVKVLEKMKSQECP